MQKIEKGQKVTGRDVMSSSFQHWDERASEPQTAEHGGKKWNKQIDPSPTKQK